MALMSVPAMCAPLRNQQLVLCLQLWPLCSDARSAAGGTACSCNGLSKGRLLAGLTNFNAITSKKANIRGPVHRTVHKGDNAWQVR